MNPYQQPNFQPYTELYLLVENILDADFYRIVLKLYRRNHGFFAYDCKFYSLMGGGAVTAKVMEKEVMLGQHFCLAISESDRHRPKGPMGQTVSDLISAVATNPFNCSVCWLEHVKEIENLIPERVVRYLFPLRVGEIDVFARDASFFDMKCGLQLTDLLEDKDNDYWKNLLPEKQPVFSQRAALRAANRRKDSFQAALKSSNSNILPGFCTNRKRPNLGPGQIWLG